MMEVIVFFILTLLSSIIGSTSGLGGGFILRPTLELVTDVEVVHISFLTSITVFCVALTTLIKQRKHMEHFKVHIGLPIALGSVAGGIIGSFLFDLVGPALASIQSIIMITAILTLLALQFFDSKIKPLVLSGIFAYVSIGVGSGIFAAFLGIGGGPLNLAALTLFLSMELKTAALYSIFIIFFSQSANLIHWVVFSGLPDLSPFIFLLVMISGIAGAIVGSWLYKKVDNTKIKRLYTAVMIYVLLISTINLLF